MFTWIYTPRSGSKVVSGSNGPKGPFCLTLTNGSHLMVGGVLLPIRGEGRRASRGLAVRLAQAALKGRAGYVLDQNGEVGVYVHPRQAGDVIGALRRAWKVAIRASMDVDAISIEDAELAAELAEASPIVSLKYFSEGDASDPSHWVLEARYEDFSSASQRLASPLIGDLLGKIDDFDGCGFRAGPVSMSEEPTVDDDDELV